MTSVPDHGALASGLLPDGRAWWLYRMLFTVRLAVGDPSDEFGYDDAWCYDDLDSALVSVTSWIEEGGTEPTGWHRHPGSGRRRPDGDAEKEYVNP